MNKKAKGLSVKYFSIILLVAISFVALASMFILLLFGSVLIGSVDKVEEDTTNILGSAICSATGNINESSWDQAFTKAGVLSSKADKFKRVANDLGIDPVLMAAISFLESTWGSSSAAVNKNNIGGLMDPATNWSTVKVFPTLDEGIEAMGRTLKNRILVDGLTTIEKLGNTYAPIGAANDPNNLNINWIPTVSDIVSQLGGLTMNCEVGNGASNGLDFDFSKLTNEDVSDLRKNIAKTGFKWLGKPYIWGGGRNHYDVANGRFDCSSFVRWVFEQNGIHLGEGGKGSLVASTDTLKHKGKRISMSQIKVGDVIFWDTWKKDGHIGIYIGDGKFIGANGDDITGSVNVQNVNSPVWTAVFSGHVRSFIPD